jgi:hypothetical protein
MGAVGLDAIQMYTGILNDPTANQTEKNAAQAWLNRYSESYIKQAALDAQKSQVRIDTVVEKLKVEQQAAARNVPTWDYSGTVKPTQQAAETAEQNMINSVISGLQAGVISYIPRTQSTSIYDTSKPSSSSADFLQAATNVIANQYTDNSYMGTIAQSMVSYPDSGVGAYQKYQEVAAQVQTDAPFNINGDSEQQQSDYSSLGGGYLSSAGEAVETATSALSSGWQYIIIAIVVVIAALYLMIPKNRQKVKRAVS